MLLSLLAFLFLAFHHGLCAQLRLSQRSSSDRTLLWNCVVNLTWTPGIDS